MFFRPQFTITPQLLTLVEQVVELRERIQSAVVAISLQKSEGVQARSVIDTLGAEGLDWQAIAERVRLREGLDPPVRSAALMLVLLACEQERREKGRMSGALAAGTDSVNE